MSKQRTADQAFVREVNLSIVLRHLQDEAPISRAQIATVVGLNKSTVSSLVDDLLKRGLIYETGMDSDGKGRPATLLEINPDVGCLIGVQFGVDFVAVVLTDFKGKIRWRQTTRTNPTEKMDQILSKTFSLVSKAIDTCEEKRANLLGLGLSVPGTVNTDQGMLIYAPNLQWKNVPLRKIFSERTGLKVIVENDANAAAIAEHLFGMARQIKDFIFVFAGVGIGGGLFLNGELYRGKVGYAGEIGHAPIVADFSPLPCHCGNFGCWETFTNQASILYRMQTYLDGKQSSIISELITQQKSMLSVPLIIQAADLNDESAILSFTKAGAAMGQGFAGLINTFNPEKIILGGPLASAGKYLLPAIEKNMVKHSLNESGSQVQVLLSSFGADASLIGAIAIVADDILSNPMQIERR